jgi:hypothetical protein
MDEKKIIDEIEISEDEEITDETLDELSNGKGEE